MKINDKLYLTIVVFSPKIGLSDQRIHGAENLMKTETKPGTVTLFTEEILRKLDERERELKDGGFEVADTKELRERIEARRRSIMAAEEAA